MRLGTKRGPKTGILFTVDVVSNLDGELSYFTEAEDNSPVNGVPLRRFTARIEQRGDPKKWSAGYLHINRMDNYLKPVSDSIMRKIREDLAAIAEYGFLEKIEEIKSATMKEEVDRQLSIVNSELSALTQKMGALAQRRSELETFQTELKAR